MPDFEFGQQRKLPYSLEAEQSVLGSIMIDPESFTRIAGKINHTDFYLEEHRDIYLAMQNLFLESRQIDPVTLIDRLVASGVKDRERTVSYVKVLAEAVPTAANILDYAAIVRNKSLLRQLIEVSTEIADMAFEEHENAKDVLSAAESKISALSDENVAGDFVHMCCSKPIPKSMPAPRIRESWAVPPVTENWMRCLWDWARGIWFWWAPDRVWEKPLLL